MTRAGTGFVVLAVTAMWAVAGAARGQVKDWEVVVGLGAALESSATATVADGEGNVVIGGEFRGGFRPVPLVNQRGWDGYVWKLRPDGGPVWPVPSHLSGIGGDVRLTDVALAADGRVFCGGRYDGELVLGDAGVGLPVPPREQGFVAWCGDDGGWQGVFPVVDLLVESLAVDGAGGVYVTGQGGELARRYLEDGALVWSAEGGQGISAVEIAIDGGACYVAGTVDAGTTVLGEEKIVISADPSDPAVIGQASGVVLESSEEVSFRMRLGAFGGGRVRVVVEEPAGGQPVVQAGASHSVVMAPAGEEGVVITGDSTVGNDGEVVLDFNGVMRVRIEVDFVQAAAEPPGTVIDYSIGLSTFTTLAGIDYGFDFSGSAGVVADDPFRIPAGDTVVSGVDFKVTSIAGWGQGHVAEIAAATPLAAVNGSRDVFLARLDAGDGELVWIRSGGGDDVVQEDSAGEIGVDPWGEVRFGFAAGGPVVNFSGTLLEGGGLAAGEAFLVNVEGDGDLVWGVACGRALQNGASMGVPSLDVDGDGVAWVTAGFDGAFGFHSGLPRTGVNDAVVVGIGAGGGAFLTEWSSGPGVVEPLGSARGAGRNWIVGRVVGGEQFGSLALPAADEASGFLAVFGDAADQGRYVVVPSAAGRDVDALKLALVIAGAQPYLQLPQVGGGELVAVHVRNGDLAGLLGLVEVAGVEADSAIEVAGTTASADWALGRLNSEGPVSGAGPWSYGFDDTCVGVRFYLIDTAVDVDAPFVSELSAATLDPVEVIRGVADPLVPVVFEHGSRMLGLVAGGETGAAPESPLAVRNYDVFPSATSGTTYASYLVTAIYRAIADHEAMVDDAPGEAVPAVMLISLTSTTASTSFLLDGAIDAAVAEGITVVLSAGNSGGAASGYVPASRGVSAGVICVGGCTKAGMLWGSSNHGAAVDLLAPGERVAVPDLVGGLTVMDGTSASAALVAGAAVLCVATNPDATPAAVETFLDTECPPSALGSTAGLPSGTPAVVLHVSEDGVAGFFSYDDWIVERAGAFKAENADEDSDGSKNLMEFVRGGDPVGGGDGDGLEFELGETEIAVRLVVAKGLWGSGAPGVLRDGSALVVETSDDLKTWEATEGVGFEVIGPVSNTRLLVEATFPVGDGGFVRLKVTRGP